MKDALKQQKTITCPLCGGQFSPEQAGKACEPCGKSDCGLLCCPQCGYGIPAENTRLTRWLRGLLERKNP